MHLYRGVLHAAKRNVRISARRTLGQVDDHKQFRRGKRALHGVRHTRRVADEAGVLAAQTAFHLAVAPLRRTMAVSGVPEAVIACLKPAAMESTPTSTATTPAMPIAAAATAPRRRGMLSSPNFVMEPI